jgi:transposase
MTIPGVGPIAATAITALVPAAGTFRAGRDFAAWLGLTPLQKSTGGKQKLGAISKRGERTIRRLLILGASAVIRQACPALRTGRILAGADAAPQAEDAGYRGLGQQDGSCCLGALGQRRRLQSSGHGSVS